jgi:Tfp pilus assembly protein PilV
MRLMTILGTGALSLAFMTAGAMAQNQQTQQSTTQSTTSTDAYGQTQTTTHHKARKSQQTTLPDGTTVNSQQKTDATRYDANGNPIAGQKTTSNSQDVVSPDGTTQTHTQTQTHTESNPQTVPPPTTPR